MMQDSGSDTIENAVVVCPNCRKKLHLGEKRTEMLDVLYSKVKGNHRMINL